MLRLAGAAVAATLLAVLPISLDSGPGLVQVSDACAQATSCKRADDFICSTFHEDHIDYACYTGCEPT